MLQGCIVVSLIFMHRTRTVSPLKAPDTPLDITVHFEKGLPVKVVTPQKTVTESLELFNLLNALGKEHGIGRVVSCPFRSRLGPWEFV